MAKCNYCGLEMLSADGCKCTSVGIIDVTDWDKEKPEEKIFTRIKYGGVGDRLRGTVNPNERCRDCGCKYGYFHHWLCDQETCPKCGGQILSCTCATTIVRSDYMRKEA